MMGQISLRAPDKYRPELPHNAYLSYFAHALCNMQYLQLLGGSQGGIPQNPMHFHGYALWAYAL